MSQCIDKNENEGISPMALTLNVV